MAEITPPPDTDLLRLSSGVWDLALLPGKGADIYSLVERSRGIDVLCKTPWGWRDHHGLTPGHTSEDHWLDRYLGGWQVLLPHAGPEREVAGVVHAYHGEASMIPWVVLASDRTSALLAVELSSLPLRVVRHVALVEECLVLTETVTNLSPDPHPVAWVHHPAFGSPFLTPQSRIVLPECTFVADSQFPGTVLPAGWVGRPPASVLIPPDADERRAVFGALVHLAEPVVQLLSPALGFGIALEWDATAFPYAWFWQECHANPASPWNRNAYAIAIEPANVLPATGPVTAPTSVAPVLAPQQTWSTQVVLRHCPLE